MDPLINHGRHFGRTIQAFCRVSVLIRQGLAITVQLELGKVEEEQLDFQDRQVLKFYRQLLALSPTLEERLMTGSEQDIYHMAEMITKGSSAARSDDTRSLKAVIVDWIMPPNGVLIPPLQRNIKTDRGFHHDKTGELLCPVDLDWKDPKTREELRSGVLVPSGEQWPRFLYRNFEYDHEDPWEGLFRSGLLLSAFKHVFTSPSSVTDSKDPHATKTCNASRHGMTQVTIASLAYVATQLRFALCSSATFSRSDSVTDSETFYNSMIDLLEDPEEQAEVRLLLAWWNR
ncbi:hypothetical protein BKA70DRAFT_1135013 [Coprinopsis sp. MPI-PUGE-AT-0042]|nr:hypothetical protein BKA70DRAFT_1135013 [Coprinopsis sp. MPI-PUGE-AT-0042]